MEIYTTLTDALNSIDFRIIYWQFQETDNIFDRNALLNIADQLEPIFNPDDLNYYMPLPDGRILLLLMQEKQIMELFTPYEMKGKEAPLKPEEVPAAEAEEEPKPEEAPAAAAEPKREVRFCTECGAPLKPGARFCVQCGKPLA